MSLGDASGSYVPVPRSHEEPARSTPAAPPRTPQSVVMVSAHPHPLLVPGPAPPPVAHAAPLSARVCYFLLGAGLLAAWNALITATDYFGAVYPGWHTDRLFTVSYLPVCMMLLAVSIRYPDLPPPAVRIRLGYIGFTAAMAAVPLVDALLVVPSGAGGAAAGGSGGGGDGAAAPAAPVAGLAAVALCVGLVGACDGLCQGALFGEAAQLPSPYMHALVSGTASSGLLVCVLRLASKASFEAGAARGDPADRARGLRNGTRLYFALAGLLSLSCWVVYDTVLPRLRTLPSRGPPPSAPAPADHGGGGSGGADDERANEHLPLLLSLPLELSKECRFGCGDGADVTASPNGAPPPNSATATGAPAAEAAASGSRAGAGAGEAAAGSQRLQGGNGGVGDREARPHITVAVSNAADGSGLKPVGDGGGAAGWPCATAAPYDICANGGGGDRSIRQQIRRCLALSWPLCCSLFVIYTVTLSIFPGFLAEDVHSALLGDWYPILLITAFNLADLVGKSLPCLEPTITQQQQQQQRQRQRGSGGSPPQRQGEWHTHTAHRLDEHDPGDSEPPELQQAPLLVHRSQLRKRTGRGGSSNVGGRGDGGGDGVCGVCGSVGREGGRLVSAALRPLRRPRGLLAAALLRGAAALPAFLVADRLQAPAWVMAALTGALGVSNGYLTAQALTMGPAVAALTATAMAPPTPTTGSAKPPAAGPARLPAGNDGSGGASATPLPAAGGYHPLPAAESVTHDVRIDGAVGAPGMALPSRTLAVAGNEEEPASLRRELAHESIAAGAGSHGDAEVVETLLVLSLVAGLNAGAYLGWLWLL